MRQELTQTRRRHAGVLAFLLAAGVVPTMVGCQSPARVPASGEVGELWNPFAPASMRVYPLTHLDRDDKGRARIVAHLDLRDAWGESVRGVGMLRIMLYRPAGELSGRLDEQELAWDIDLNDLELNTSFYDRATRTYRVPLAGVPTWVEEMLIAEEAGRSLDRRLRLVATLETLGPRGAERFLRDEFLIER